MCSCCIFLFLFSNVLELADMYGLQELKEVVTACLKIEKCHLFHKVTVMFTRTFCLCAMIHT